MTTKAQVSNSTRISTGIGERLLKGWTLLADSCPMCVHTPLVQSRAGEVYCVCCEMEVRTEAPPNSTHAPPPNAIPTPNMLHTVQDVRERSPPPSASRSAAGMVGASLLSDANISSIATPSSALKVRSKTDPSAASSAIAQKLLIGWTLLGETCPVDGCLVPLMLDPKTSTKQCVNSSVCGYVHIDSGQTNAWSKQGSPSRVSASPAFPASASRGSAGDHEDARMKLYFAGDEKASQHVAQNVLQQQPQAARMGFAEKGPILAPSPITLAPTMDSTPQSVILKATRAALLSKMDSCGRMLGVARDVAEARDIVGLISECITTMKSLDELAMKSSGR